MKTIMRHGHDGSLLCAEHRWCPFCCGEGHVASEPCRTCLGDGLVVESRTEWALRVLGLDEPTRASRVAVALLAAFERDQIDIERRRDAESLLAMGRDEVVDGPIVAAATAKTLFGPPPRRTRRTA
jgi:hypothetical protein